MKYSMSFGRFTVQGTQKRPPACRSAIIRAVATRK